MASKKSGGSTKQQLMVKKARELRELFLTCVSKADTEEIIKSAVASAKMGDRHAREFIIERTQGKVPTQVLAEISSNDQAAMEAKVLGFFGITPPVKDANKDAE